MLDLRVTLFNSSLLCFVVSDFRLVSMWTVTNVLQMCLMFHLSLEIKIHHAVVTIKNKFKNKNLLTTRQQTAGLPTNYFPVVSREGQL